MKKITKSFYSRLTDSQSHVHKTITRHTRLPLAHSISRLVGKPPPWHCGLQLPKQLFIPFTFVQSFAIACPVLPQ